MKSAFLVLGAQRSGTSVISHILSTFEIDFGHPQRFIQGGHNPIFFELSWVNDINNQLVQQLGYCYTDFFFPTEVDFVVEKFEGFEQKIQTLIKQEWRDREAIALKDPRFSLTFPVWQRVLTALGYRINIIFAFRCPSGFLASNQKLFHNWAGWTEQRHLNFWLQFNLAAIYFTRHCSTYWLNYDNLMAHPQLEVQALADFFELNQTAIANAVSVIQPAEYHHHQIIETGFPLIDHYYKRLCSRDLTAADYLQFRDQFESFLSSESLQLT